MNKTSETIASTSTQNKEKISKKKKTAKKDNDTMKGIKSIEEVTYEKEITSVEKAQLLRVFALLCGKGGQTKFNTSQFESSMISNNTTLNKDQSSTINQDGDPEFWSFGKQDVARVLLALLEQSEPDRTLTKQRYLEIKHEVDSIAKNMVWEEDEDLNEEISFYEFELMYKRCIFDKTGLEPRNLFYLIEFLMFDKNEKKRISIEDTLELTYVRAKNYYLDTTLDEEIEYLFGKEEQNKSGADVEEKQITWAQFESKVRRRNYDMRNKMEEDKKTSSSTFKKKE